MFFINDELEDSMSSKNSQRKEEKKKKTFWKDKNILLQNPKIQEYNFSKFNRSKFTHRINNNKNVAFICIL